MPAAGAKDGPLIDVAEAKAAADKPVTFSDLLGKRRRTDKVVIPTINADGEPTEFVIRLQALGGTDYDELLAKHKPTNEQKDKGMIFNPDTFMPALIAACTTTPAMSYSEAAMLYNSEEWSGGEISSWFLACQRVNNGGVDIPFTVSG